VGADAAQKRVARAVERLRGIFARDGVALSAPAIIGAVSAHSLHAAPPALAHLVVTGALAQGAAATGSALPLAKGALKLMAWTKLKITVATIGAGVLCVAAVAPLVLKTHPPSDGPAGWRQRFEAAYRLNDGEVLKHIAPPFIPERAEYYHREEALSTQAKYAPEPPAAFMFGQDGPSLHYTQATFGAAVMRLLDVTRDLFGIGRQNLEGPEELQDLALNGDWTVRAGTDRAQLLRALEAIIQRETGRSIKIEPRQVERTVLVARGGLLPAFRAQQGNGRQSQIDIYAEQKNAKEVSQGGGTARQFLDWIGDALNLRVVNEISPETQSVRLNWRIYSDAEEWHMGDRRDELLGKVLDNITQQTGITFTPETRMVEVWFVSESK
jgi:hypothetical protein